MEALELHKLETLLISKGSSILDKNTDAIRYQANKEIDLFTKHFWDKDKTVLKYRKEHADELKVEHLRHYQRLNYIENDMFYLEWIMIVWQKKRQKK